VAKARKGLPEVHDLLLQDALTIDGRHTDQKGRRVIKLHRIGCLGDIIKVPDTVQMTRLRLLPVISVLIDKVHRLTTTQESHVTSHHNKSPST
jgi:hypothetical protein